MIIWVPSTLGRAVLGDRHVTAHYSASTTRTVLAVTGIFLVSARPEMVTVLRGQHAPWRGMLSGTIGASWIWVSRLPWV